MLDAKEGLVRRGVRKLRDHVPAVVTEVSCPSDAVQKSGGQLEYGGDALEGCF